MPKSEHTLQQAPGVSSIVTATSVMSTRFGEAYRLHPNRLKLLASKGQGYLFASRLLGTMAIPIVYGPTPELNPSSVPMVLHVNDEASARELRFYERANRSSVDAVPSEAGGASSSSPWTS